jgi:hypothetical protein
MGAVVDATVGVGEGASVDATFLGRLGADDEVADELSKISPT